MCRPHLISKRLETDSTEYRIYYYCGHAACVDSEIVPCALRVFPNIVRKLIKPLRERLFRFLFTVVGLHFTVRTSTH